MIQFSRRPFSVTIRFYVSGSIQHIALTVSDSIVYSTQTKIKLCPRGAQTCALQLFCDRDLEINPMTLKLEGVLDILKLYVHTDNEAASLRHSERKS